MERVDSGRPAVVVALISLCLAVLLSPGIVERFISLSWHIGDITPVLWVIQSFLAASSVVIFLARARVSAFLRYVFPSRRILAFSVIATALSSAIGLVVIEIMLRVAGFPFVESWEPLENALAQFDDELGWTYKPSNSVTQTIGTPGRQVTSHFDQFGLRVPTQNTVLDPDAPTIFFVGGSYTMGHGVEYEETFAARLENKSGFGYQVVNLGVQGYGTDQALLRMNRHIANFDVKAVVYTYISAHPMRNENWDRRYLSRKARFVGTKPRFKLRSDGTLRLAQTAQRYGEFEYSRVFAIVRLAWFRMGPKPSQDLTKALIRAMRDSAESHGAKFIVIHWHRGEGTAETAGLTDMGLSLLDTSETRPPEWNEWVIEGDGHPSASAHGWVSDILHERFLRLGLLN